MESVMNVRDNAQRGFAAAGNMVSAFASSKALMLIGAAVVVIMVLAIIAIWIWRKLTSSYVNQVSYSVAVTREGVVLNRPVTCLDTVKFPNMAANGQRATYSFWIYIHNLNSEGAYKYVFRRAGSATDVTAGASVLAFLDNLTPNKLHFRLLKETTPVGNGVNPTSQNPSLVSSVPLYKLEDGAKYRELYTMDDEIRGYNGTLFTGESGSDTFALNKRSCMGITVPYLPIQRWVHVAIVVNEQVNGGTITAYVDAEQVAQIKNAGTSFKLATTNSMYLGGENNTGVDGLISYLTLHNFDMNTADVYKEYRAGPIRSLMSKLGLPSYGVRSPIYPLSLSK